MQVKEELQVRMSTSTQIPSSPPAPGPAPVIEGSAALGRLQDAFTQPFVAQHRELAEPPVFDFQVMRSLRMHRMLAMMLGATLSMLLILAGLLQPKTYSATSMVYVEPVVAQSLNDPGAPGFDQFRYGSFIDQQMQTVVRLDVLTTALRSLPDDIWKGPAESEQSAVARLAKALNVERVLSSYQMTIQLKTSDPVAAAAIVNAVTETYLKRGREDEFKQADLREQLLSEERARVQQELEIDRKEQGALGASMGLASPAEGAGNPYDAELLNLRGQLAAARQARDVAAAQLASVSGEDEDHHSGLRAEADEAVNTDAGLSAKKAAVNARKVVLETMMAGLTAGNPQYRQAQDEIADLDRSLDIRTAEVRAQVERRVQDKLRVELQRTAGVESQLNAQLAAGTAKATGAAPKLQRAAELNFDIQRLTARYTTVDNALNALQVQTSGPGTAHLALAAVVPLAPDPNHRNLFFMVALPFGLVFGTSAAVLARKVDQRLYLGSDLERVAGFSPIAVLPARDSVSERVLDEYVLRLAAGVESAYRTAKAQSFLLTAVSAQTETQALLGDLARKLQSLRLRVLVVHASALLVTSQETMERPAARQAISAGASVARFIQAREGIASAKLERFKAQHDIILIAAAPILHSAESEYAARCADATILVAESAVTSKTEFANATSLLSRLRISGVGAVLDGLNCDQADEAFRLAIQAIELRRPNAEGENVPNTYERAATVQPEQSSSSKGHELKYEEEEESAAGVAGASYQPDLAGGFAPVVPATDAINASSSHAAVPLLSSSDRVHHFFSQRSTLPATAVQMQPVNGADQGSLEASSLSAETLDDQHPVGRFVSEQDEIGAVPTYTRSRIRLAFQEQEVNSRTTWFKKLFRGDPPAAFRVVPEGGEEAPPTETEATQSMTTSETWLAQLAEDTDLDKVLDRLNNSGERKVSPRPRALSSAAAMVIEEAREPQTTDGISVPFVERRNPSRLVDIEDYRSQEPASADIVGGANEMPFGSEYVPSPSVPASAISEAASTSVGDNIAPNSIPVPGLTLLHRDEPVPALSACAALNSELSDRTTANYAEPSQPEELRRSIRPLRPLTFQQLSGETAETSPSLPSPAASTMPQDAAAGTHGASSVDLSASRSDVPSSQAPASALRMALWPQKETATDPIVEASQSALISSSAAASRLLTAYPLPEQKDPDQAVPSEHSSAPCLTRPWRLLSQFGIDESNPQQAHQDSEGRATHAPTQANEGL